MIKKTDEQLVREVQEGDVVAYEELVRRYQRGLFVFVIRILRDEGAASDIVQESLFKVYQYIDHIDTSKKFSTFVFEVAKNGALSELRRKKRIVSLEEIVDLEDDESFIEQFLRSDLAKTVRNAVKQLPEKYREVVSLYYFHELSYEEISKKLHIPLNTVRTNLKRAKEQLKRLLPYENS